MTTVLKEWAQDTRKLQLCQTVDVYTVRFFDYAFTVESLVSCDEYSNLWLASFRYEELVNQEFL